MQGFFIFYATRRSFIVSDFRSNSVIDNINGMDYTFGDMIEGYFTQLPMKSGSERIDCSYKSSNTGIEIIQSIEIVPGTIPEQGTVKLSYNTIFNENVDTPIGARLYITPKIYTGNYANYQYIWDNGLYNSNKNVRINKNSNLRFIGLYNSNNNQPYQLLTQFFHDNEFKSDYIFIGSFSNLYYNNSWISSTIPTSQYNDSNISNYYKGVDVFSNDHGNSSVVLFIGNHHPVE